MHTNSGIDALHKTLTGDGERELVQRAKEEPDGIKALYRHYLPRIFGYVVHRVGERNDAEDIVSDVFLTVVDRIHQFEYRGEGSFTAWLFQIASNQVTDFHRKGGIRLTIPLADMPDIAASQLAPDDALERKERFNNLRQLIRTLSPRRQEIVNLRFFGGLRNKEIADVLGLDERTVASHLSRALNDLQRKLMQKDASHE